MANTLVYSPSITFAVASLTDVFAEKTLSSVSWPTGHGFANPGASLSYNDPYQIDGMPPVASTAVKIQLVN
jgi:hypothetical protein